MPGGLSVKTDDRGKGRKLVSLSVLEETCRGGDRLECSAEIGEHRGGIKRMSRETRGRGWGMATWAAAEDGSCLLIVFAS